MSLNDKVFVAWEENIICHEKGNRVTHFYLKDASGDLVLAIIGTERSIRHMLYVVSDEFMQLYVSNGSISACTKWRTRREVVDWLTSFLSKQISVLDIPNLPRDDSIQCLASHKKSLLGLRTGQCFLPDQMRKLRVQKSDTQWCGASWICTKLLKHYPAFFRNGTMISVHSFVYIMVEEGNSYLGYLEDMYEDKKGWKKVKVRWFYRNEQVNFLVPPTSQQTREVFITRHSQVIQAECIDGPAIVLTPKHYEKWSAKSTVNLSSEIHTCFRQLKDNKIKPFALTKLRGYYNQPIMRSLETEEFARDGPVKNGVKRVRSYKHRLESGSNNWKQMRSDKAMYPTLKIRLPTNIQGIDNKGVLIRMACPSPFKVDEKIEVLCQDSGIRGCWFRCKVLEVNQKQMKVQYNNVEDVDGTGNLEEWIPISRKAAPDKLAMRCSGRLRIRPWPLENSTDHNSEIGAAVDAWWHDGWWEGVLVRNKILNDDDSVQVYFPDEEKFETIPRKNVRHSRDWIANRWVDIEPRPDIVCRLDGCCSSMQEDGSRGEIGSDELMENMKRMDLGKLPPRAHGEYEEDGHRKSSSSYRER